MTKTQRGGWSNPASADNGRAGGRLPTSVPLSGPAVIYLRELTRQRLGRLRVTRAEMGETVEELIESGFDQLFQ